MNTKYIRKINDSVHAPRPAKLPRFEFQVEAALMSSPSVALLVRKEEANDDEFEGPASGVVAIADYDARMCALEAYVMSTVEQVRSLREAVMALRGRTTTTTAPLGFTLRPVRNLTRRPSLPAPAWRMD